MSDLLRILLPPLVWLAWFSGVYGLHGLGCAMGWHEQNLGSLPGLRVLLVAAWVSGIVVQVVLLWALRTPRFAPGTVFARRLSGVMSWTALIATLWALFPVVFTRYCA